MPREQRVIQLDDEPPKQGYCVVVDESTFIKQADPREVAVWYHLYFKGYFDDR